MVSCWVRLPNLHVKRKTNFIEPLIGYQIVQNIWITEYESHSVYLKEDHSKIRKFSVSSYFFDFKFDSYFYKMFVFEKGARSFQKVQRSTSVNLKSQEFNFVPIPVSWQIISIKSTVIYCSSVKKIVRSQLKAVKVVPYPLWRRPVDP